MQPGPLSIVRNRRYALIRIRAAVEDEDYACVHTYIPSHQLQARIIATGNPITSSNTTRRTAQFGISKNGKIWLATCISSQATTAYAIATL